jgi:hypothetical protein
MSATTGLSNGSHGTELVSQHIDEGLFVDFNDVTKDLTAAKLIGFFFGRLSDATGSTHAAEFFAKHGLINFVYCFAHIVHFFEVVEVEFFSLFVLALFRVIHDDVQAKNISEVH